MSDVTASSADQKREAGKPAHGKTYLVVVVLIMIGTAFALGLMVQSRNIGRAAVSTASASGGWLATGAGITRGIGGLSLFRIEDRTATFLAVFDSKLPGEPRIAFVELEDGKPPVTRDLNWPGKEWPVDLEAVASVPGKDNTFMAVTSGGQLWRLQVQGEGAVTILGVADLPPANAPQLEGFDIQRLEGKLVAVWAGRGDGPTSAALCVGVYDDVSGKPNLTHRTEFRAPWPDQPTVRHISDLRVDPFGVIIVTSSMDTGNDGPYDSALYVAGKVAFENGSPILKVNDAPIRLRTDYGRKVEALELVSGTVAGLILGCDDENGGGAILPTWRKP